MTETALLVILMFSSLISDEEAARCRSAASKSYAALTNPTPSPQPSPAPSPPAPLPSNVCTNCNGTGILGDGTIKIKCPVCDGTGKAKTAPAQPAKTYQAPVQTWQRKRIFPR